MKPETHTYTLRIQKEATINMMGQKVMAPTVYYLPVFRSAGKINWWSDEDEDFVWVEVIIKSVSLKHLKKLCTISRMLNLNFWIDHRIVTIEGKHHRESDGWITPDGISLHMKNIHATRRPSIIAAAKSGQYIETQKRIYDVKTNKLIVYRSPKLERTKKHDTRKQLFSWFFGKTT